MPRKKNDIDTDFRAFSTFDSWVKVKKKIPIIFNLQLVYLQMKSFVAEINQNIKYHMNQ